MDKFVINGNKKLEGNIRVSGAKNVALKALVAACLTSDEVIIDNVPLISDFFIMLDIIQQLGGTTKLSDHTVTIQLKDFSTSKISLDAAALIRTSVMFLAPLLARNGEAIIPNPGGCRIGARPIDRTVEGLRKMNVDIHYQSKDGYFYAKVVSDDKKMKGMSYTFPKNTHTGTETLILASVLAEGKTKLENAAEEPEVDELIEFLNSMGAKIKRTVSRTIEIEGVEKLYGTRFAIGPDRNEIVTFAVAALVTKGDIYVENVNTIQLKEFLSKYEEAGGGWENKDGGVRFFYKGELKAVNVTTSQAPGFMTDWQGPWAVLMTQSDGESIIHETVYESRFGYISQLKRMGAKIQLFNPPVENPKEFYNFNLKDDQGFFHAAKINGPTALHNAVVEITDLRAGATLVLAALAAEGESVIYGLEHLERGYENFEERINQLGGEVRREREDNE